MFSNILYTLNNSANLKKRKVTTSQVLLLTSVLSGIMIVYMIITNSLNFEKVGSKLTIALNGQHTYEHFCEIKSSALEWVLYGYEGLILLMSVKVCYDTRNIPDAINEAPSIAKIIFSVLVLVLIIFILDRMTSTPEYIKRLLTGVAFFAYNLALFVFYFGYKCYHHSK